VLLTFNESKKE
jgi:hypothetical protein